jgi:hypothetical protein
VLVAIRVNVGLPKSGNPTYAAYHINPTYAGTGLDFEQSIYAAKLFYGSSHSTLGSNSDNTSIQSSGV